MEVKRPFNARQRDPVLSVGFFLHGNGKQKVSAGNVHVESNTKDGNGKTKQRKAKVWLREVCRKKESQKKMNAEILPSSAGEN